MPKKTQVEVTPAQLKQAYARDQAQMEQLQNRMRTLQQAINEVLITIEAVKEIGKAKEGEDILISLGAGIYAEAKISNIKKMKRSLAGSVLIESDTGKALSTLEEEKKAVEKDILKAQELMQKTARNMQGVTKILQQGRMAVQNAMQEQENTETSNVS